jgi:DNA-binding response OmpR family regulator
MRRILIIEDNLPILENIVEFLELSGYEVSTAIDGRAGLDIANSKYPDLIICDIMMPELDGYEVLSAIRKNADLVNVPFIFLTALSEKSEVITGMALGAVDYITKPFEITHLLDSIENCLNKTRESSSRL